MPKTKQSYLFRCFEQTLRRTPESPALVVHGSVYSYNKLHVEMASVAAELPTEAADERPPNVAVLTRKSATAYVGILATHAAGFAHVPLSVEAPPARNRHMLDTCKPAAIIVDAEGIAALPELLKSYPHRIRVIVPQDVDAALPLLDENVEVRRCAPRDVPFEALPARSEVSFIVFTSGSTGVPKGVMETHDNIEVYLQEMLEYYRPTASDRFAQVAELTFDPSIHDMFLCWMVGACLYPLGGDERHKSVEFVRSNSITHWQSTPSAARWLERMGALTENVMPSLTCSLFIGETLPVDLVKVWMAAAPNTYVENTYGPTETTVAITRHRFDPQLQYEGGVVPIGRVFPKQKSCVLGPDRRPVAMGEKGELYLGGSQVTAGYMADPEKTNERFVILDDSSERWYRTGDLVRESPRDGYIFLGRADDQLKILGHRVQLSDVESAGIVAVGHGPVIAVGWPQEGPGQAGGIVLFVPETAPPADDLKRALEAALPPYMVPSAIHQLADFPFNRSSKIDRRRLLEMCDEIARWSSSKPADDSVEDRIRKVWAGLLGVNEIADDQDFFELGGNSQLILTLAISIGNEFGKTSLTPMELVKLRTVRQQAAKIRGQEISSPDSRASQAAVAIPAVEMPRPREDPSPRTTSNRRSAETAKVTNPFRPDPPVGWIEFLKSITRFKPRVDIARSIYYSRKFGGPIAIGRGTILDLSPSAKVTFEPGAYLTLGWVFPPQPMPASLEMDEDSHLHVTAGANIARATRIFVGPGAYFEVGAGLINEGTRIECRRRILLGKSSGVGIGCHIRDSNVHGSSLGGKSTTLDGEVFIGEGAWIGSAAFVHQGSRIGPGAVVAAASVVAGQVAPGMMVGGNPAMVIGKVEQ